MTFGLTINIAISGSIISFIARDFLLLSLGAHPAITADYHAGFWIYLIAAALFALVDGSCSRGLRSAALRFPNNLLNLLNLL